MEFIIILGPLAIIAAIVLYIARRVDRLYEESARWPSIDAHITESRIARNSKGNRWPSLRFEYEFRGQKYHGTRLTFVQRNMTMAQCEAVVERYPVGAQVKALVDDNNPKYAILERTAGGGKALRITVAIVGAIFLFVLIIVGVSK